MKRPGQIYRILIKLDKFINRYFLFGKWETISKRAAKNRGKNLLADGICWLTDKFDKDHCKNVKQ